MGARLPRARAPPHPREGHAPSHGGSAPAATRRGRPPDRLASPGCLSGTAGARRHRAWHPGGSCAGMRAQPVGWGWRVGDGTRAHPSFPPRWAADACLHGCLSGMSRQRVIACQSTHPAPPTTERARAPPPTPPTTHPPLRRATCSRARSSSSSASSTPTSMAGGVSRHGARQAGWRRGGQADAVGSLAGARRGRV